MVRTLVHGSSMIGLIELFVGMDTAPSVHAQSQSMVIATSPICRPSSVSQETLITGTPASSESTTNRQATMSLLDKEAHNVPQACMSA